jgi:hypothetical protein
VANPLRDVLELDLLRVQIVSLREPWLDTGGRFEISCSPSSRGWPRQEPLRRVERTEAGLAELGATGEDRPLEKDGERGARPS